MSLKCLFKISNQRFRYTLFRFAKNCLLDILKTSARCFAVSTRQLLDILQTSFGPLGTSLRYIFSITNKIVTFAVIAVWIVINIIIINGAIRRVDVKIITDIRRIYIIVITIRDYRFINYRVIIINIIIIIYIMTRRILIIYSIKIRIYIVIVSIIVIIIMFITIFNE